MIKKTDKNLNQFDKRTGKIKFINSFLTHNRNKRLVIGKKYQYKSFSKLQEEVIDYCKKMNDENNSDLGYSNFSDEIRYEILNLQRGFISRNKNDLFIEEKDGGYIYCNKTSLQSADLLKEISLKNGIAEIKIVEVDGIGQLKKVKSYLTKENHIILSAKNGYIAYIDINKVSWSE